MFRNVLAYAGRFDNDRYIDPFPPILHGCLTFRRVRIIKAPARKAQIDHMRTGFLYGLPEFIEVCPIGRTKMTAQRIDVVDPESLRHEGWKVLQVHSLLVRIVPTVGWTLNVRSKWIGRDRQPGTWFFRKLKIRMRRVLTCAKERGAGRKRWHGLQKTTASLNQDLPQSIMNISRCQEIYLIFGKDFPGTPVEPAWQTQPALSSGYPNGFVSTKGQLDLVETTFETARPPNPLFCHQEFLEKLSEHGRDSIGKRASFLLQRLSFDSQRVHYKTTQGVNRGWRRSRLGGNHGSHFYAWWAPKNALPLKESGQFSDVPDGGLILRDIRHHDDHTPLAPQSFDMNYMPVSVHDLRREEYAPLPWTQPQIRFAAARQSVRLLKGHPGSGKTTALLHAADSSAAERTLYITYSRNLAALARDYFDRFCSSQKRFTREGISGAAHAISGPGTGGVRTRSSSSPGKARFKAAGRALFSGTGARLARGGAIAHTRRCWLQTECRPGVA
jgi:hypothetical protein